MRICIITLFYKPAGGGIPRYVDNLSKSFAKLGHDVDIVTVSYETRDEIESDGNVAIYRLSSLNVFGRSHEECKKKSKDFLRFMNRYLDREDVDIIVAQNLHAAISSVSHTLVLNMVAIQRNIPLVLTIHSFPDDPSSKLKIALVKNLFWDKIVVVSSSLAETFFREGIGVDKLRVTPPGIDLNVFKPHLGKKWLRSRVEGVVEKDLVILHASRTDSLETIEEKGVRTLLKAFSFIHDRYKNVKLLIASAPVAPPFEEDKKKAIESIFNTAKLYNIQDKLRLVTFQPGEMPLVYNGSDIFVMASRLESFGIVYAEAMACGLPVVGTSTGGIPEIIVNGKCGYLVPPDNPVELAKYLSILLTDAKKRKTFGSYGRKIIKSKFNIDKISERRIGNYKSLIYHKRKEKSSSLLRQIAKE